MEKGKWINSEYGSSIYMYLGWGFKIEIEWDNVETKKPYKLTVNGYKSKKRFEEKQLAAIYAITFAKKIIQEWSEILEVLDNV